MTAKDTSAVGLMQEANDALGDSTELRRRLDEQGYIFLRQIMAKDKLLSLRQEMTEVLMEAGWLVAGTDPMDGIARIDAQCTEGDPEYAEIYHRVYSLEAFHQAGHWPEVLAVMEQVVGGPVLPHPQKIARLWFPQYTEHTTPMHQDFVHFQGSFNTLYLLGTRRRLSRWSWEDWRYCPGRTRSARCASTTSHWGPAAWP